MKNVFQFLIFVFSMVMSLFQLFAGQYGFALACICLGPLISFYLIPVGWPDQKAAPPPQTRDPKSSFILPPVKYDLPKQESTQETASQHKPTTKPSISLEINGQPCTPPASLPEMSSLADLMAQYGTGPLNTVPAYTVIDLETTGLDADTCDIIEAAAIRVRNGEIVDQFSTLIRPHAAISERITAITGITNEMVACAQPIEEALPKLLDFIGEDRLLGHNVSFDVRFIEAQAIQTNLQIRFHTTIDTLALSRKLYPNESHKLQDVVSRFDIAEDSAHRALDDVKATKQIFDAMCLDMKQRKLDPWDYIRLSDYDPPQALDPAQLAWMCGDELRKEGQFEEALAQFDEAERLGYVYQNLYLSRAMLYRKQKDLDAEINAIKEGLRVAKAHGLNPELLVERLDKTLARKEKQLAAQAAEQEKVRTREEKQQARQAKEESRGIQDTSAPAAPPAAAVKPRTAPGRPMLQLAEDGSILQRFDSVADASRTTGVNPKGIRDAASGVQKRAGGFRWQYADVQEESE